MDVRQAKIASKKSIELFLSSTNVDFIAVAFGNAHGEYNVEPDLHYDLVEYTTTITDKPFVVHGGSGLSDEVLLKLINIKGVKKINISTDLKMAYKRGIELGCTNWIQPINASHVIHDEIEKVAVAKMTLISGGFGR
jgi:fructose/tagatose bisphosphate aldolase